MLNNIKRKFNLKKCVAISALLFMIAASQVGLVSAQTVTQGYSTDKVLQRGVVVSLDSTDTTKVVPTTKENQDRVHGVVIAANDATFTLSDIKEKTFVATIGRYDALVSNEEDKIQPGDFLAISSIGGIAKKAGAYDAYTIGKAIEGFDGTGEIISKTELKDSLGNSRTVSIGRIQVDLSLGPNPLLRNTDSNLPEFLEKATEAIAGKQVSPVRAYISVFILAAASAIAGGLLYSGIRSSVISIGRNPLSKKSITKSMMQIILTSIIIFLFGLFGVYLLLRL